MRTFNDLRPSQVRCIEHIGSGEDSFIWATVGAGKTAIALTAMLRALEAGHVKRWLVVAPKRVSRNAWINESAKWEHLQEINPVSIAGRDKEYRTAVINGPLPVVVMNYENLAWLLDTFEKTRKGDTLPFDGIVWDEIDKMKNVSSNRFKAIRNRIKHFKMRIGMTGTPRPNHDLELWGETFMIDAGVSFGRSFYKWRRENFYQTDYQGYKWAPFPATHDKILDTLADLVCVIDDAELDKELPGTRELEPRLIELPASIRATYQRLEDELFLLLYDKKGKRRKVEAANQGILVGKLQQITAGFSYVPPVACECGGGVEKDEKGKFVCAKCSKNLPNDVVWHSKQRFDELDDLLSELQGEQCVIVYHFIEELAELRRRYPDIAYLGGGVSDKQADKYIEQFAAGKIDTIAIHPASAGHGLDGLQDTGAHHIAFLTLPWSGGMYKQVIGRLKRGGNSAERVHVHRILNRNTIDEDAAAVVSERLAGNDDTIDAMKGRLGHGLNAA